MTERWPDVSRWWPDASSGRICEYLGVDGVDANRPTLRLCGNPMPCRLHDLGQRPAPDPYAYLPENFAQAEREELAAAMWKYAARMEQAYEQTAIQTFRQEADLARTLATLLKWCPSIPMVEMKHE